MSVVVALSLFACGRPAAEVPVPAEPEAMELAIPVEQEAAPSETAPRVFFVQPTDGATVTSPVKLVFGVTGMDVRAAGDLTPRSGHHHLIVSAGSIPAGQAVPNDETHIHYGQGQTEAELTLPPGLHRLTLQFADGNHMSYGEPMAATISVTVAESAPATE